MPDLLAHTLLAYGLCQLLAWRYEWLTAPYRTAGMAGAFIPDLAKIDLVFDDMIVEQLVGIPVDWFGLHTGGAVALSVLIGGMVVATDVRQRVLTVLTIGAASHLLADGLLLTATGRSYPMFWPVTRYVPPTPGLYLSTDPGTTVVAVIFAVSVWLLTRYRQ